MPYVSKDQQKQLQKKKNNNNTCDSASRVCDFFLNQDHPCYQYYYDPSQSNDCSEPQSPLPLCLCLHTPVLYYFWRYLSLLPVDSWRKVTLKTVQSYSNHEIDSSWRWAFKNVCRYCFGHILAVLIVRKGISCYFLRRDSLRSRNFARFEHALGIRVSSFVDL